ncbi:putative UPF0481 protein At3g02645 [Cynara cardunculus var. scolymus]|nr:putative UPF0481 protein At3g02645 [Cynara cardunculus var. scolymus]XP_024965012.1 putative UPF0481 protein At3g02645 [Cynara cardunculus var. scolymus]
MANVDVEVGGRRGPRNKTKWWHRNTPLQDLLDCIEKGQNLSIQQPPSIYKIPSSARKISPDSFKPQVVSIGPLHRQDKALQEFEEQKTTYLHHLLQRLNIKPEIILDKCLQKVNDSIHKIRESYGGMMTYTDVELAQMMVIDACFILDFLFLFEEHQPLTSTNAILTRSISRDLVLLENQIPFFVLQDIFKCTISKLQTTRSLTSGILQHLQILSPFKEIKRNDVICTTQPHHILGLLQRSFHPTDNIPLNCPLLRFPNHSALELDKAGVKFEPKKDENWTLAIDFSSSSWKFFRWWWGNRTLRMHKLCIDDSTELFLRNLIAYEQCTPDVPDFVTSYVCAIDMLLDTKEDLSKLVESKVLTNNLGSNEDSTKMLNKLSEQFAFKEFYYMEQWKQLDDYYNRYVPKNIALLRRTYFDSPWKIIALLASCYHPIRSCHRSGHLKNNQVDSQCFFCLPSFWHYVWYLFHFLLKSH